MTKKVIINDDIVYVEDSEAHDPEGNPLVIVMTLDEYNNSPEFQDINNNIVTNSE